MQIAIVLAVLSGEPSDASVLEGALQVANRTGGRVRALFVQRDPSDVLLFASPDGMIISPEIFEFAEQEIAKAGKRAREAFETWRAGPGGRVGAEWTERSGQLRSALAAEGRVADLVVVASPAWSGETRNTEPLETALFDTGRPVLVIPKHVPADFLGQALIAWKSSAEAARAVAAVVPLLAHAKRVDVFAAEDETGKPADAARIVGYLAAHGVTGNALGFDPGPSVGVALVKEAERHQATLLVLGAYSHSRLRELVFGGVTQHVIDHADIPVLMAH
jgi:nucleotide-binding universal stress UspA family protein